MCAHLPTPNCQSIHFSLFACPVFPTQMCRYPFLELLLCNPCFAIEGLKPHACHYMPPLWPVAHHSPSSNLSLLAKELNSAPSIIHCLPVGGQSPTCCPHQTAICLYGAKPLPVTITKPCLQGAKALYHCHHHCCQILLQEAKALHPVTVTVMLLNSAAMCTLPIGGRSPTPSPVTITHHAAVPDITAAIATASCLLSACDYLMSCSCESPAVQLSMALAIW